jgi:hypothetical protein
MSDGEHNEGLSTTSEVAALAPLTGIADAAQLQVLRTFAYCLNDHAALADPRQRVIDDVLGASRTR